MKPVVFLLTHLLLPLTLVVTAAVLFDVTGLDIAISDLYYDFTAGRWIFREAWWAKELLHNIGRALVILVALLTVVTAVRARKGSRLARWRRPALYALLAMVIGPSLVRVWQENSARPCPRNTDRYGGEARHLALFERQPEGIPAGRCFPSKHASLGFSLTSFYFALLATNRRWALAALGIALTLGLLFSFGQVVRGAHFVSHNLWSAVICWTVEAVLYWSVLRGHDLPGGRRDSPGRLACTSHRSS